MKQTIGIFLEKATETIKTFKVDGNISQSFMKDVLEKNIVNQGKSQDEFEFIGKYMKQVPESEQQIEIEL